MIFDKHQLPPPWAVSQLWHPQLSVVGLLIADIDAAVIRVRRGVEGKIPGRLHRNQCNFDLARECREGQSGQIPHAPWVATPLRHAYPFGHYTNYPVNVPSKVENELTAGQGTSTVSADDLVGWCRKIQDHPSLPPIDINEHK